MLEEHYLMLDQHNHYDKALFLAPIFAPEPFLGSNGTAAMLFFWPQSSHLNHFEGVMALLPCSFSGPDLRTLTILRE
ncbi:MAG: hypothetical protein GX564_09840 [Oligosphaeraceae bacterium]|nr:hypothetical protein [Oligosphaeraceae bacterium]